jgi:hypothetical protein
MQNDQFNITILPDGKLKVETDEISAANHLNASDFLRYLATLLGGDTITQPKAQAHRHVHGRTSQRLDAQQASH